MIYGNDCGLRELSAVIEITADVEETSPCAPDVMLRHYAVTVNIFAASPEERCTSPNVGVAVTRKGFPNVGNFADSGHHPVVPNVRGFGLIEGQHEIKEAWRLNGGNEYSAGLEASRNFAQPFALRWLRQVSEYGVGVDNIKKAIPERKLAQGINNRETGGHSSFPARFDHIRGRIDRVQAGSVNVL